MPVPGKEGRRPGQQRGQPSSTRALSEEEGAAISCSPPPSGRAASVGAAGAPSPEYESRSQVRPGPAVCPTSPCLGHWVRSDQQEAAAPWGCSRGNTPPTLTQEETCTGRSCPVCAPSPRSRKAGRGRDKDLPWQS